MTRASSRDAYRRHHESGRAASKTEQIRAYIEAHPLCTRREVEDGTGLRSNEVSGRVNEMLHAGAISERGTKRVNGVPVSLLAVAGYVIPEYIEQELPLEA